MPVSREFWRTFPASQSPKAPTAARTAAWKANRRTRTSRQNGVLRAADYLYGGA